ncbi:MAG TPA: hypothetical protein P5163_19540 [Rubrivivax sp.]|nr:hypothetical protein [Rubrivivax sp.]
MRLEINTNGAWRVVGEIHPSEKEAVMDAVLSLQRIIFNDTSWKITDGTDADSNGPRQVALLDPRRHGLVWKERK